MSAETSADGSLPELAEPFHLQGNFAPVSELGDRRRSVPPSLVQIGAYSL